MEIKDLKANSGKVDIVAQIVDKEEPRSFEKFGKTGSVCNAKLKDETGEVKMTLWNEDIDKVKVGDKVHLENGWCSEFKDELQVSSGKFGKIEVIESGEKEVFTNDTKLLNPGQAVENTEENVEEPKIVDDEELVE
jgi:replication factor A1